MEDVKIKANGIIKTIKEELKTKSNGRMYHVCTVELTEGLGKGKTVFAARTVGETKNDKGETYTKSEISLGQKVEVYGTLVPGKILWEIRTLSDVSDDNDVLAAFGFTTAEVKADTIEMDVL